MSERSELIRRLPCVACVIDDQDQPSRTEEHHLNLGGKAGQKRLGDQYSIPLCGWHHRAEPIGTMTKTQCSLRWGPSLADQSREFRDLYGSDKELLTKTDELIAIDEGLPF